MPPDAPGRCREEGAGLGHARVDHAGAGKRRLPARITSEIAITAGTVWMKRIENFAVAAP